MRRLRYSSVVMTSGFAIGRQPNWVKVGPVTVQPSEMAKLGLALYLGVVLATFRKHLTTFKRIMVPGGVAALVVLGLVLAGKDMGTAIILAMLVAAAFWVAGLPVPLLRCRRCCRGCSDDRARLRRELEGRRAS